jgi:hypothetical protein
MGTRIELTDSFMSAVMKMSEGNPGAISCIMSIMESTPEIDPHNALGGLGNILSLDTLGIYGPAIYVLWNDQCNRDDRTFIMLLRAYQLGFLDEERIRAAANPNGHRKPISPDEIRTLDDKVCSELERFKRKTSEA